MSSLPPDSSQSIQPEPVRSEKGPVLPSGSTAAVSLPAVQLGSVAGTVNVTLTALKSTQTGQAVPVPSPAPATTIPIARQAPDRRPFYDGSVQGEAFIESPARHHLQSISSKLSRALRGGPSAR